MENGSFKRALLNLGLVFTLLVMLPEMPHADVMLIGNSISYSFNDMEARFVPAMEGSGFCGRLHVAEPSDACSPLRNKAVGGGGVDSPFALVQRGACNFDRKIRNAQDAGFKAAIVYNNIDRPELVPMGGNSTGVVIYAIFVSKATGQLLLKYAGDPNMECWIVPSLKNAWSVMAISFAVLVTMALVLAICIVLRKYWIQEGRRGNPNIQQSHGMSYRLVKALPSLIFSSVTGDNCTSETCAICLENYTYGEKLRVLPCFHKFHALCVDNWLTMWRTFCPVCKRDARSKILQPPMTENTPLLYGNTSMSSGGSAQSSLQGSSYMHVSSNSSLPHTESLNSHHCHHASTDFPGDVRNTSFLSLDVHSSMLSIQNLLCASPEMTPSLNFQHGSFCIPSSYNASPQSDASGPCLSFIPSCGGSASVISPFNSTHSLPGYQECCV